MKHAALLTLQPHTNYGGLLQAYALQTLLTRKGYAVDILSPKPVIPGLPWYKGVKKEDIQTIMQYTDAFICEHLHLRNVPFSDIKSTDYDAYVVGSDQIWRYHYVDMLIGDFRDVFFAFTEGWDVKRVAYAPSFGLDTWEAPEEMIPEITRLLARFDAVSAREDSGAELCRTLLKRSDAQQVLDPTMMLDTADYEALIENYRPAEKEGDMACYVLGRDEEKEQLIRKVAHHKGLTPFDLQSKVEQVSAPVEERIQPPLEHWLYSIHNAKMVVTDSFHATVFSILFHRPFIVTGNPNRGLARLQSILKALGLERHLVLTSADYDPNYDYSVPDEAYQRLATLRQLSADFLNRAL